MTTPNSNTGELSDYLGSREQIEDGLTAYLSGFAHPSDVGQEPALGLDTELVYTELHDAGRTASLEGFDGELPLQIAIDPSNSGKPEGVQRALRLALLACERSPVESPTGGRGTSPVSAALLNAGRRGQLGHHTIGGTNATKQYKV